MNLIWDAVNNVKGTVKDRFSKNKNNNSPSVAPTNPNNIDFTFVTPTIIGTILALFNENIIHLKLCRSSR